MGQNLSDFSNQSLSKSILFCLKSNGIRKLFISKLHSNLFVRDGCTWSSSPYSDMSNILWHPTLKEKGAPDISRCSLEKKKRQKSEDLQNLQSFISTLHTCHGNWYKLVLYLLLLAHIQLSVFETYTPACYLLGFCSIKGGTKHKEKVNNFSLISRNLVSIEQFI